MKRFPHTSSHSNLRVFTSCLLSFLMLLAPVASLAASVKTAEAASASAEAERKLTADQKMESFLFNAPMPAATPDISATMTDAFADGDGDLKAEFGETITYTADITNNGPVDATGVSFNSTIDPNTDFVSGSAKVSPLAFNDTYVATKDTTLTGGASLLTNDTGLPGTPTLVVSAVVGCADVTAPFDNCATTGGGQVDVNADGTFTYDPPSGFEGSDTFNYTISNGVTPPNPGVDDTATVTFNVDAAPTVTATTPVDNALGVDPTANISVTFSEPVNVTGTWFTISCTTSGAHTATVTGGPSTFTLNPDSDFVGNETCTVTIVAAQVTDQDSNDPPDQMAADYVFDFQTDAAPAVTTTSPTNGAVGVATNANVVINFSENITHTASAFKIECPAPGNLKTFVATGSGTNQITLNPTADLPAGTTCTVTVDKDEISDSDAFDPPDNMAADYVFSFTTDAAPAVTTTTPTNGATNLPTNTTIQVNFSENVNATTSSFKIECPAPGNLQTFTLSASPSNTFTLTPTANLPGGVTCTVTVIALQISDQDGNDPPDNMVADYVFSFTTDAAPSVTSTVPTNNATNVASNANITVNFSETVDVTANAFSISCATSGAHTFVLTPAVPGGVASFSLNPDTDFTFGEVCTVTVDKDEVSDTDAFDPPNNMVADYVFMFTVDLPPSVTTTTPTNGQNNVSPSTNITINFSESVNATANAFKIECPAPGNTQTFTQTASPSTSFTLDPTSNLPQGVVCTVTVDKDEITDVDSGDPPDNMTADYVFTFNIPPDAVNDSHPANVVGNVFVNSANIPFSATSNDVFASPVTIDQVQAVTTVVTNTITATTVAGGTVVMTVSGADIGKYTYNPPVGYEGADSFTYRITNGGGNDTATVSLNVSGMVWFINNGAGAGDGRMTSPFNTLAAFQAVNNGAGNNPAAGDNIFIYQSATAYVGPVTLLSNQRLIGQDSNSSLTTLTGLNPVPSGGTFPAMLPAPGDTTLTKITSGANAIELNNAGTSNQIYGLTVGNTTGVGISAVPPGGGAGFGSLTVADVNIDEPASTRTGQALLLQKGTGTANVSATFGILESSSAGNGITLTNVAGSITVNSGSLSALTAEDILVNGGAADLTFASAFTITNSASRSVDIQNKTGGTVDFNGLITDTGTGINLQNNASTTLRFDGGLNLTTTSNSFVATSNGTLAITDPNAVGTAPDNTIVSTQGTALNVAFTTIHADGLNFKSISVGNADASPDPVNGIVLNTTGTGAGNGGLVVAGNSAGQCGGSVSSGPPSSQGTANAPVTSDCTGGTIQNTTGAAISLNSTRGVSLTRMWVKGAGNDGIQASNVTNFTLSNSLFENNGNASAEANLDFGDVNDTTPDGLFGTATITSSTIRNSFEHNASFRNQNGTLSLTVTDSQFTNTSANAGSSDGLTFDAVQTANMTVNVQDSYFAANRADHFQAAASNSAVYNITFKNNTLIGGHTGALGQGITINAATAAPGYSGRVDYDIDGNNIRGAKSNAIIVNLGTSSAAAVFDGFIRNNVIGATGVALSGSSDANCIEIDAHGNGTHTLSVTNNILKRCFDRGILVLANDGNGDANLTVTGNNISEMTDINGGTGTPREAFHLSVGATSTNVFGQVDDHAVCLNITGNVLDSPANFEIDDLRLRQRFRTSITLPGYTPPGGNHFDAASVENFVEGNNAGPPAAVAEATFNDDGAVTTDGYFGGAACATPSASFSTGDSSFMLTARASQPATLFGIVPVAKLRALGGEVITHHNGAAAKPAALKPATSSKPAARKAAEPVALQTSKLETVKAARTQPTAIAQARRSAAAETFTSHASFRPKAQPQAKSQQAKAQPKRAASETFTSHASAKAKAQPQAQAQPVANKAAATAHALTPQPAAAPVPGDLPVTIGTIPAGKKVRVIFEVTVKSAANYTGTSASVSAQGTVTFDDPNNPPTGTLTVLTDDPAVGGANDPTVTPVDSQPDLVLTKDDGGATAVPGGTISYTLTYNNTNGKRTASGVVITETVPANTTFNAGASTAGWSCTPNNNAGSTCTLSIPDLPAGSAGSTATFAVTVNAGIPAGVTDISNTASIADDGTKGADGTPADNSDTDTTPITANSDLSILKSDGNVGVQAGNNVTYTLSYSNIGNQGATGVVITETVPADTTFESTGSTPGWSCPDGSPATTVCTINIGAVAAGGSGSVTFVLTTSATPAGTEVTNTASIDDDNNNGPDPSGNDSSTDTTPFDDVPTLGTYSDQTIFVTQGVDVMPTAPPADDNPGFDTDVTVSGAFTGGATVDDDDGEVHITNAAPAGVYTVTVTTTDSTNQTVVRQFQLTVNKSGTTTTLSSNKNPSFNNQNVTFTATVTSNTAVTGPPTGTVDFLDGASLICDDAPLDGTGKATCSTSTLSVAGSPHSITATYNGDAVFDTSTSAPLMQTVNPSLNIEVNTLGDESDMNVPDEICDVSPAAGEQCTLRAAIETANFVPSDDVITFNASLNNGTITLGAALPDLGDNLNSGNLVITGPGAALLKVERNSGAAQFRIFTVPSGKTVDISGLTISGGDSALDGGGVSNAGTLTLDEVVVSGNSTDNDGGGVRNNSGGTLIITGSTINDNDAANLGGGISNVGTLTVTESTISDNDAINGGGVSNTGGTLTVTNSTVSGNRARNDGGGLRNVAPGSATLTNVTVTDNRADSDGSVNGVGGGIGGGIRRVSGTVTLRNTIVAENFNDPNASSTPDDINGTVTGSFNLIGAGGAGTLVHGVNGNQVGVDPKLHQLVNNGGPTKTHALKPNSPALDAGDNTLATNAGLTNDQRGPAFNRFVDSTDPGTVATVDIGAYEAQVVVEDISNKGTAEDATLSAFNFEVAEDAGITGFTVTATSSDTTLVPNANLNLGGAGTTRNLSITPAANKFGTTTITVTVSGLQSGVFPVEMSDTFDFVVTPVADTPDIADVATNEDTQSGPIFITKNAVDGAEVTHFRISAITGGTLYMPNGTTMLVGDNYVSFADAAAGLRFTPLPNYTGPGHFSVQAATGNIPAALGGGTDTSTISVNAVNDQPVIGPLNNRFILEDSAGEVITLTGIGPGGNETQTLVVTAVSSNPAIVPNPVINYTSPNSSGTLTYAPVANANGMVFITVTVNDGGGGTETVQRVFSINITPVNDMPSFTKGPDQTLSEDPGPQSVNNWANPISPGAPNESGQVLTFQVTNNNNALFSAQPAISPTGTLTYTPKANTSGTATVTVILKDGSGTANSGQDMSSPPQTFNITINAANDAPVNNVPAAAQSVVKNGTLTFNASNLVSVTDVDAGAAVVKVALTAQKGTTTLSTTAGLSFSTGDGTNDQYMIFTGTLANINAAMNGMQFKPTLNYTGAASLKIISNDLGNAPGPTQLTDTDTININVTAPVAAGPSSFSLGAPVYTASEGALRATVTVTREGDKSAPASVNYKTADPSASLAGAGCGAVTGHASNRCDYATAVGTLRFAAGESSREISVPVVNDVYAEGPESFTLSLSKPVGAKLGQTTSAVVTISDDDANGSAPVHPLDADEFFVRQLYVDVLGREADANGLTHWLAVLRKCNGSADCGRAAVASAFFKSAEFKDGGYFAYRLYRAALSRSAGYDELTPDMARLASARDASELAMNKSDLVADFMARAEFKDRYGSRTQPADYVDALLLAAALPNHPQRAAWVAGLADGSLTRGDVLWQLADSEDVSAKFAGESEVAMQYHVFFRREADAGVSSSLELSSQKPDLLKVVSGFLNSVEYRQRFGR